MSRYANATTVSTEASRSEIEKTLRRYKADAFMYAAEADRAVIQFRIGLRQVRFLLQMPDPKSREFTQHSRGVRTPDAAEKLWEQACRQRWRALALVIKAKLEAVSAGITTIEDEFLAHTVLPDGQTVGQFIQPQLQIAYETGRMPSTFLLEGPK